MKLFTPTILGDIQLSNHVIMAPMTRSRAMNDNVPGELMATYYEQRAGAGLIITEGTAPSPNGLGYPRIPGMYSHAQIFGWKKVTDAVHQAGGKIFIQLMHTGRVSHQLNMPAGAEVVAPSAVELSGKMYTDQEGEQPHTPAREMKEADIDLAIREYRTAAANAIQAGFDGVEIHGANGYLIQQFINPASNKRDDKYGGGIENRSRFLLEVTAAVIEEIGANKTGVRLSPFGVMNDMDIYDEEEETYAYIAKELSTLQIVYLHLVDHESMGAPEVPTSVVNKVREAYKGTLILSGGYDKERAEQDLQDGKGDLIAFGRPFIANPDLVFRMQEDIDLADPNQDTFYTPGAVGYIDYPSAKEEQVNS